MVKAKRQSIYHSPFTIFLYIVFKYYGVDVEGEFATTIHPSN